MQQPGQALGLKPVRQRKQVGRSEKSGVGEGASRRGAVEMGIPCRAQTTIEIQGRNRERPRGTTKPIAPHQSLSQRLHALRIAPHLRGRRRLAGGIRHGRATFPRRRPLSHVDRRRSTDRTLLVRMTASPPIPVFARSPVFALLYSMWSGGRCRSVGVMARRSIPREWWRRISPTLYAPAPSYDLRNVRFFRGRTHRDCRVTR